MATQTQTGNGSTTTQTEKSLLDQILDQPLAARFRDIDQALQKRIESIEDLLPDGMKGQGERLAKRAVMTLNRKVDLYADVTPSSFVRCVLEAAEFGLAVDGRFAHAVPYNNKIDEGGRKVTRREVQLQVDYKGIVAVARRNGLIIDCWGRVICDKDEFEMYEADGECHYRHVPALVDPGKPIGVLAVIKLPNNEWRYEWMNSKEIDAIRARSKSWAAGGGPWKTDDGEMRKKTAIKRALKMYSDDAAMTRLLDIDDRDYEDEPKPPATPIELPTGRTKISATRIKPKSEPMVEPAAPQQELPPEVNEDADTPPETGQQEADADNM